MKSLFKIFFAIIITLFIFEIISFAFLVGIDFKNNLSITNSLNNRLDDFNFAQEQIIIEYGDFDPVAQYWPIANSEYANTGLKYNQFGYLDNFDNQFQNNNFPFKDKNLFRILFIGGSTALGVPAGGQSIKNSQTIPALLEKKLNLSNIKVNGKSNFEVINLGQINGYSGNNLVRYSQYYIYLEPDMIITYNGYVDGILEDPKNSNYMNWNDNSHMHYFKSVTNKNLHNNQIKRLWWLPFTSSLINKFLQKDTSLLNINIVEVRNKIMDHHKKIMPIPHLITNYHKYNKKQNKDSIFKKNMEMFASINCNQKVRMISVLQPLLSWSKKDELDKIHIKGLKVNNTIYKNYLKSFNEMNNNFKNCSDVNFYDGTDLLQDDDYQPDGAHLNVTGNIKIADFIFNKIIKEYNN